MPYLFTRNGSDYGGPYTFLEAASLVNQKAAKWGGGYRVKPSKAEPWGDVTGRPAMLYAVQRAMRRAAWGGLIKIEMGTRKPTSAVFLLKKVMPETQPAPEPLEMYTGAVVDLTRGNERIAKVATYIKEKCPRVRCSGWVYTRTVSGTSVWSQHSNWATGGNAIDLTVYNNDDYRTGIDMDGTDGVRKAIVRGAKAGDLEIHRAIFKDKQYVYPNFDPAPYGGTYHTHVHVEGRPLQTGTPVDAP